jgi:hypothetical protein
VKVIIKASKPAPVPPAIRPWPIAVFSAPYVYGVPSNDPATRMPTIVVSFMIDCCSVISLPAIEHQAFGFFLIT